MKNSILKQWASSERSKENPMKTRILGILGGIALLLSAGSVYAGGPPPKPVKVSGTYGGSAMNWPNIAFDGVNTAALNNWMGHDNFGNYIGQRLNAYLMTDPSTGMPITGPPCTAPDGTAGESFVLEFAEFVNTYNFKPDQIWGYSFNGSICESNTTGSNDESEVFTILGGSGLFTGATGTVTIKQSLVVGTLYYLNQSFPPYNLSYGSYSGTGWFGQITGTETGTITK
jgi:hypothetical protein